MGHADIRVYDAVHPGHSEGLSGGDSGELGEALKAGREPSNAAAVWGYGAADCGFADAGRVKLGAGRPKTDEQR
jgi:hypothetical protein